MSVHNTERGYDYQYKATILVTLQEYQQYNEVFVEKPGSEDATLIESASSSEDKRTIEIQMKSESSIFNMEKLVEWLCHFQEHSVNNNLLSRLTKGIDDNDKNNLVIFITKSRCSDDVSLLSCSFPKLGITIALIKKINSQWKKDFVKAIVKTANSQKGRYKEDRKEFCIKQSEEFGEYNLPEIREILNKVLIWEKMGESTINEKVYNILHRKFHIPTSKTEEIYQKLLKIVTEKGRDGQKDIIPFFTEILKREKSGAPKIEKDYSERTVESELIDTLNKKGVLLLSGLSNCGKSQTSKSIAYHFYNKGYDYKICSDIKQAGEFLNSNYSDEKILIIEDPFGHADLDTDFLNINSKLKSLIGNKNADDKIIVTSRKEILLEGFDKDEIRQCKIKNFEWIDLTITKPQTLLSMYRGLQDVVKISPETNSVIRKGIKNSSPNHLLQIGELVHLLNVSERLKDKNYKELTQIARHTAHDIALSIKEKDIKQTLAVLSMCGDTVTPINLSELAYVISKKEDNNSKISKKSFGGSFFGEEKKHTLPRKNKKYTLDKKMKKAISRLEEKRFIYYSDDDSEVYFLHPNYFEAGRYLFYAKAKQQQEELLRMYQRALFSLSPDTAFHAAEQIKLLYDGVADKFKQKIIKLSFAGLNSIFPNVEDLSLIFLINEIDNLTPEDVEKLVSKNSLGSTDKHHIYWDEDKIPFIVTRSSFSSDFFYEIDDNIVISTENSLKKGKIVSLYEAWNYIKFKQRKSRYFEDVNVVESILKYNESFIRLEIVELVLSQNPIFSKDIIEVIFKDKHPDVVNQAIRICFDKWEKYNSEERKYLSKLIILAVRRREIAIRIFHFITTFGKNYASGDIKNWDKLTKVDKKELWNLWSVLFPIVISNNEFKRMLHSSRFSVTMEDAIEFVDKEKYLNVLEIWYKRIDSSIRRGHILSDSELCIAEMLAKFSIDTPHFRINLFKKLLNYPYTGFLVFNLSYFLSNWSKLTTQEKEIIFNLIESNRKDVRWINAVCLTEENPPQEVVKRITGQDDIFEVSTEEFFNILPEQLIKDSLSIFCGFPSSLSNYTSRGRNKRFWEKKIYYVLNKFKEPYFDIALYNFLEEMVYNGNDIEKCRKVWRHLCILHSDKSILATELIYHISSCVINIASTQVLWSVLFETYRKEKKAFDLCKIIASNIEFLQSGVNSNQDLIEMIEGKIWNKIYPLILPDITTLTSLKAIKNSSMDEFSESRISGVINFIREKPIRFKITMLLIEELNLPSKLFEQIKNVPNQIKETGGKRKAEMRKKKEYKLENWIGV